jgi:hypothetical protein
MAAAISMPGSERRMDGPIGVRRVAAADLEALGRRLATVERGITYPLGRERFAIDHGEDYFAFFRRGGTPCSYVAEVRGEAALALVAVVKESPLPCAYLCDLKAIAAASRPALLPRLLEFARQDLATRGITSLYGIAMEDAAGGNRLLERWLPRQVATRASFADVGIAARLAIYSLDAERAALASPLLARRHGGEPRWISLAGIKDLVLASTSRKLPLLHAAFGTADGELAPRRAAVHMFCLPTRDPLCRELSAAGIAAESHARVVAAGMAGQDFSFVRTSEI